MPDFRSMRLYRSADDESSATQNPTFRLPPVATIAHGGATPAAGMPPITSGTAPVITTGLSEEDRSPFIGVVSPVTGAMSPVTGTLLPITGAMSPITGEADSVTGALKFPPLVQTGQFTSVAVDRQTKALQIQQTGNRLPMSGIVHNTSTNTLSLVVALQSTIQPARSTGRAPLVIPAERKRVRGAEPVVPDHHLRVHWRHVLAALATFGVLIFTMLTMTPLGSGNSGISMVDSTMRWVQNQPVVWNILPGGRPAAPAPPQKAQAQAQPATTNQLADNLNLPQSSYVTIAQQAAAQYGISPYYFVRQIQQESGFNPYAVSPVGAIGIAQFMPATAAGMGVNPYDPVSALYGAARMMSNLSAQYGGDYAKALAAYNAGSGAVNSAVAAGGANWLAYLPAETQNYVHVIMG